MMDVLIISENFFGYAERIAHQMRKEGFGVDLRLMFVPDFSDKVKKIAFGIPYSVYNYYQRLLRGCQNSYDVILVINGKDLPDFFMRTLAEKYPKSMKVLYLWDDVKNSNPTDVFLNFFDKKYTYSKIEAQNNPELIFQPFFFSEEYFLEQKVYDASFIGTLHSDRYEKLNHLKNQNPEISFFFYLFCTSISFLKYLSKIKRKEVQFKTMNYEEYVSTLAQSKAHIELPHPDQTNITTRAIEVLGTKTKLITTSNAIKNYDIYNENNVFILNENNADLLENWLKKEYKEYPLEILHQYQLSNWIKEILK